MITTCYVFKQTHNAAETVWDGEHDESKPPCGEQVLFVSPTHTSWKSVWNRIQLLLNHSHTHAHVECRKSLIHSLSHNTGASQHFCHRSPSHVHQMQPLSRKCERSPKIAGVIDTGEKVHRTRRLGHRSGVCILTNRSHLATSHNCEDVDSRLYTAFMSRTCTVLVCLWDVAQFVWLPERTGYALFELLLISKVMEPQRNKQRKNEKDVLLLFSCGSIN